MCGYKKRRISKIFNCMTQYNIELQSIQDKIARGASLIEPANYCGNPPDKTIALNQTVYIKYNLKRNIRKRVIKK